MRRSEERIWEVASLLEPQDILRLECMRVVMGDAHYYPPPVARREPSGLDPALLGFKKGDDDLFDIVDAGASYLVALDRLVTPFPKTVSGFGERGVPLLLWCLIRVIGRESWDKVGAHRASRICRDIENEALAYHASCAAVQRSLPTVLEVCFASLTEAEETLDFLRLKTQALTRPWRREAFWPAAKMKKKLLPATFLQMFANIEKEEAEEEPGVGREAAFPRAHHLSGSHVRALFEESRGALERWEASPVLYGLLRRFAPKT